jgi:hypothetical protein
MTLTEVTLEWDMDSLWHYGSFKPRPIEQMVGAHMEWHWYHGILKPLPIEQMVGALLHDMRAGCNKSAASVHDQVVVGGGWFGVWANVDQNDLHKRRAMNSLDCSDASDAGDEQTGFCTRLTILSALCALLCRSPGSRSIRLHDVVEAAGIGPGAIDIVQLVCTQLVERFDAVIKSQHSAGYSAGVVRIEPKNAMLVLDQLGAYTFTIFCNLQEERWHQPHPSTPCRGRGRTSSTRYNIRQAI